MVAVLLLVFSWDARSAVVAQPAVVKLGVGFEVGMVVEVVVFVVLAAVGVGLCLCHVLRLLRKGSRTAAGTVSRVYFVLYRILCRCVGLCLGLVAVRSRVG